MRYSWLGAEFVIIFLAFTGGGLWLDFKLDTLPGFTAVLGVVGLTCALYRVIRDGLQFRRWLAENRQDHSHSESDNGDDAGDAD
jgi:PGF-CTERM protein